MTENRKLEPPPFLLEKFEPLIEKIADLCHDRFVAEGSSFGMPLLAVIRQAFAAKLVYFADNGDDARIHESPDGNTPAAFEIHHRIKSLLPGVVNRNSSFIIRDVPGTGRLQDDAFLIVPIIRHAGNGMLVIGGDMALFRRYGEVSGFLLGGLFNISDGFRHPVSKETVLCGLYDQLKSVYGYVSDNIYERRFDIFRRRLQKIEMHYEPIVHLSDKPKSIKIKSWEALARIDHATSPVDLFQAAELWGTRFQTELDLYCLRQAIESYRPQVRRVDDVKPLHVNIYPATLARKAYREEVNKLIEEELLSEDEQLILEISEKTWIDSGRRISREEMHLADFREIMVEMADAFGVGFAIDDFGIGFSSIFRLHQLRPSFIKIDKELLQDQFGLGKEAIRYLRNLKHKFAIQSFILIAEGADTPEKLALLGELNIKYAQGHIFSKAKPHIASRIDPRETERIAEAFAKGKAKRTKQSHHR